MTRMRATQLAVPLALVTALMVTIRPSSAVARVSPQGSASDSAAVAGTIARFHDALANGDSATALSLLSDDVVILESGGRESQTQYRDGHLRSDMAFARAVKAERSAPAVRVSGDVAWASSTSTTQGEYNGRTINSSGAELMVLVRTSGGWRITAIHWSSRQRRAG
jgi:ketosteroid isomerase-like protein